MKSAKIFSQYRHKSHFMVAVMCPVNIPTQSKVNDALTGMRYSPFPEPNNQNILDTLGECSRCSAPVILSLSTVNVPHWSDGRPISVTEPLRMSIWLWELEQGAERSAFVSRRL